MEKLHLAGESRFSLLCWLALMFLFFFVVNYFTPIQNDDFVYRFSATVRDGQFFRGSVPISTWEQLVETVRSSWYSENFRLSNILAVIFGYFDGGRGWYFNLANAFVLLLTVIGAAKLALEKVTGRTLTIAFAVFIVFCPDFNATCLWMAGALNYLWGACLLIMFLICFEKTCNRARMNNVYSFFGITLAALASWIHEAVAVPLFLALLLTAVLNKRERRAAVLYLVPVGCMLCILLTSPGTLSRMGGDSILFMFYRAGLVFLKLSLIPALILIVLAFVRHKEFRLQDAHIVVWLVLAQMCVYSYAGGKWSWGESGPAFFPHFCMCIAVLMLIRPIADRYAKLSYMISSFAGSVVACCFIKMDWDVYSAQLEATEELSNADTVSITFETDNFELFQHLQRGLPTGIRGFVYTNYNAYYDEKGKLVITNRNLVPRSCYASMRTYDDNKIRCMRCGTFAIFQLPKGWAYFGNRKNSFSRAESLGMERYLYFYWKEAPDWVDKVHAYVINKYPLAQWTQDYVNGRHYAILEIPEKEGLDIMNLPIIHEKTLQPRIIRVPIDPGIGTDVEDVNNQVTL